MPIRNPGSSFKDQLQRKRTAPDNPTNERVHKYLKDISDVDCISIGPSDKQTDLPRQEHQIGIAGSKSAPSRNQRRTRKKKLEYPFLHTASQQVDTSLFDGAGKLAQARGGCTKPHKPSKGPNMPDVIVGPLTEQALRQLNKANRPFLFNGSPSMASGASSAPPGTSVPGELEGTISAYHSSYSKALIRRGIDFADKEIEKFPSNLNALKKALKKKRDVPGPDDTTARNLRTLIDKANTEQAIIQKILPKVIPLEELDASDDYYTAPGQLWDREIMVAPHAKPTLTAPRPGMTIGWSSDIFEHQLALDHLGASACPVAKEPGLAFPLFTVEVKGSGGDFRITRLQNLHNGATMLSNLWHIRQFYDEETHEAFFNKVHALSLQLTQESIQLSCYWATRKEDGQLKFYGTEVDIWPISKPEQYKKAYRYTCNALEWVRDQAFEWISPALATLEGSLDASVPTPPPTQSNQDKANRIKSTSESVPASSKKRASKIPAHLANPSNKKRRSRKTPKSSSAEKAESE